jgi:membrane-bound serine protease (ClpP class)
VKRLLFLLAIGVLILELCYSQKREVHVIQVEAAINPATSDYIHSEIERASGAGAECLIIELNTPGGLLKSTRTIVADILSSPIPIIIYVAPSGAQAASAGVFITMAAHVAVMAPGTNIGAAHPVSIGGDQPDSIMMEKTTNDAAAFIRTISEKRNRNTQWAEEAVRKSLSITETEAKEKHVIDFVATSVAALLDSINGKEVQVTTGSKILSTAHATVITSEKSFQQNILDIISDPNIAYIFMMLGIYGLLFELYNPGSVVPGVIGAISLILGLYSMHTLPINYAGVALIVVGIILFILEIKITSYGMLTVGGVIALGLGSIMLFQQSSFLEVVAISWEVILFVVSFSALFFLAVIGMGIRAQRRKPTTGAQGIIGECGTAITDLHPHGQIRVHGEIWAAISTEGTILQGSKVLIEQIDNLTLKVRSIQTP